MLTRAPTRPFASGVLLAKKEKNAKRQGVQAEPRERKQKDDVIEVNGVVTEALPSANFRVEAPVGTTTQTLLCTISGKIRKNFVRILVRRLRRETAARRAFLTSIACVGAQVGDAVLVELSPYDLTRGRITFRFRK